MPDPIVSKAERTCVVTIKTLGETRDDRQKVTADIPAFGSKWPLTLWLPVGSVVTERNYTMTLERGNPTRPENEGSSYAYSYYWNFKAFTEDMPSTLAPTVASTARAEGVMPQGDERSQSIERQVALKVAGELYVATIASMGSDDPARQEALTLARRLVAYFFQEDEQGRPLR